MKKTIASFLCVLLTLCAPPGLSASADIVPPPPLFGEQPQPPPFVVPPQPFVVPPPPQPFGGLPQQQPSWYAPVRRDVAWPFYVYESPSFSSVKVDAFGPQAVWVKELRPDGWGLVGTYRGDCWAYLTSDTFSVSGELDAFLAPYGDGVSVYFENLASGYTYRYNAEKEYYAASLVKAPFVLALYDAADKGLTDLDDTLTYDGETYKDTAGVVQGMARGTALPKADLMEYAITHSDNVAFRMLLDEYGPGLLKDFAAGLGGRAHKLGALTNAVMNVNDAALYMKAIYAYTEQPGAYGEKLKQDLTHTARRPYIVSDYPLAHKYGLWENVLHDMAIIYTDSPCVLVIMSNQGVRTETTVTAAKGARAMFEAISLKTQEINRLFAPEN